MNLPNKLTLVRIVLVPLCLILIGCGWYFVAALVFAAAAITDAMDGHIARKNNLVTNFGKFADPIADKIVTVSTLMMMSSRGLLSVWVPVIVVIRELMVDGLRLIALEKGRVVAAGKSGKIKTVFQMVTILFTLAINVPLIARILYFDLSVLVVLLSIATCVLTVYSGAEYFYHLRDLFEKDLKK